MSEPQLPLSLTPPRRPSFDNFAVGENQAVIDVLRTGLQPGQWYFLAGPAKSGRSHLAQSVLNHLAEQSRSARFVACRDPWVVDLLDSTNGDWIVVDDVDALVNVAAAEMALFNALNRWREAQSCVLMTGTDRSRFALPDLRSRLNQAAKLSLRALHSNEDDAYEQLIAQLLQDFQLTAGHGLITYLLRHAPRSPARLVALFERFSEQAYSERRQLTIPLARSHLTD
ncbi:MAG: hypothetical protein AAGH65_07240 [Pseudomonadota bacterium]